MLKQTNLYKLVQCVLPFGVVVSTAAKQRAVSLGFDSQRKHVYPMVLWIKVSAKCVDVNVNVV